MSIRILQIQFTTENTFHFGCRNGTLLVHVLPVSDHFEHNARSSTSTIRVTDVIHRQQLAQPPGHTNYISDSPQFIYFVPLFAQRKCENK